ncbi:MAG: SMC family ATPase, partial [Gemmatimonadaceae bacterium]
MRLNRLRLSNFRLHVDTVIDFDTGLTGIIGPNGSGKTTILEAIAWALYGMPAVRGKRQDIRSLGAPGRAGVKVELDFELAGHRYRVVRSLSTAELYLDGAASPIATSTTSVTDLVRRRLGMTQQEFFNTYFTGQKELGVMAAMGPAERAQFLSRVLGYEKLRGAQTLVRERRNLIRGELTGLQSAMPESEVVARLLNEADLRLKDAQGRAKTALTKLTKASAVATDLQPRWNDAQQERDAHQRLVAERGVRESEEGGLTRDAERLDLELSEIVAARSEMEELSAELNVHEGLRSQLHEMERLFQEEGRRKELLRNRKAVEQELVTLRERSTAGDTSPQALPEAEAIHARLRGELETLGAEHDAARTEWVRDQQEARTKRDALRVQYQEIKRQREHLADLGPESPCPICTRPLADHFREVLDELDGQMTALEVDGKYYRNRVEQLEEMPAALRDVDTRVVELGRQVDQQNSALTELRLHIQAQAQVARDIRDREARLAAIARELDAIPSGYHETRHAQLRQQHAQLAPMAERSVRLGALAEREPKVRKEIARVQKEMARVRERLVDLRLQQGESRFSEKAFEKLKADHEAAAADLRAAAQGPRRG